MIDHYTNFSTFPAASWTLVRVLLGEWVFLLKDLEVESPACTEGQDCGNKGAALYIVTFNIVSSLVMVNMVVAVILDSFTWLYSMENNRSKSSVTTADLQRFKQCWMRYDVYSTGAINIKHLKEFLELVGPPLGKKKVTGIWLKALRAEVSAIPGSSSQEISFKNLFLLLTTRMLGADALCENDSGEMEIELIQARKLGAQQAVMSTVLEEGKVITSP